MLSSGCDSRVPVNNLRTSTESTLSHASQSFTSHFASTYCAVAGIYRFVKNTIHPPHNHCVTTGDEKRVLNFQRILLATMAQFGFNSSSSSSSSSSSFPRGGFHFGGAFPSTVKERPNKFLFYSCITILSRSHFSQTQLHRGSIC